MHINHQSMTCSGTLASDAGPAFGITLPEAARLPVIVAAPHGGRIYPERVTNTLRNARRDSIRLEDRHVDFLATRIAEATGAVLMVSYAPRAMIDLNRHPDDVDWGMVTGAGDARRATPLAHRRARTGLGLVPRRLGPEEIWKSSLPKKELDRRIDQIHDPYHQALEQALMALRERFGAALLIDLHSMPPLAPCSEKGGAVEFVIGDRFGASCASAISHEAERHFEGNRRKVRRNRPYAGGYILDRHGKPHRHIHAVQIEVCRTLYLDASFRDVTPRADAIVRLLADLTVSLGQLVEGLGGGALLNAAE